MPEEQLTQQESLAIIESMINRAKNQFSENGFIYLLWGWVIFFCSTSHFILQNIVHYERYYLVWTLTWLALIVQIIYYSKKGKRKTVKTYTDEITAYVWLAFVVMLFLVESLLNSALQPQQAYLGNVSILILYGMPTFLSGIILKFRPLIIGGFCCWLLAVLAAFLPQQYTVLAISAAVMAAWIVPGYLLRRRFKRTQA